MTLSRRAIIGALFAPAIIRTPGLLMPIRPFVLTPRWPISSSMPFKVLSELINSGSLITNIHDYNGPQDQDFSDDPFDRYVREFLGPT